MGNYAYDNKVQGKSYYDAMCRVIKLLFPKLSPKQFKYACNKASQKIRQHPGDVYGVAIGDGKGNWGGSEGSYYNDYPFQVGNTQVIVRVTQD